jgi:ribosomal protein L37E
MRIKGDKEVFLAICKRCKEETFGEKTEDYCSVCGSPLSPSDYKKEKIADID